MAAARNLDVRLLPLVGHQAEDLESVSSSFSSDVGDAEGMGPPLEGCSCRAVLFTWVFPLLQRSAREVRLETQHLFRLAPEAEPGLLYATFIAKWRLSLQRRLGSSAAGYGQGHGRGGTKRGRLLLRALGEVHFPTMRLLWLGRVVQAILGFSFPFFLSLLIAFVEDEAQPAWRGIALSLVFLASQLTLVILDRNISVAMQSIGLRIRSSMTTAICQKILILRQDALLSFSTGKLNNMITTDVDKAKRAVKYIHILITAPLQIVIGLFSLYRLVGVSAFIGLGWMGLVILLNPILMSLESRLQDRLQSKTDERVRKVTETISAIQVIKCYGWEEPTKAKVEEARRIELLAMWRVYCLYTIFEGLWSSVIPIMTAIMFASYSLLNPDNPLKPVVAFTAMSLLEMVQEPLFSIPWVLNLLVDALVAAKRLERLFFLPEAQLPCTANIGSFCKSNALENGALHSGDTTHGSGDHGTVMEDGSLVSVSGRPRSGVAVHFQGETFEWPRARSRRNGNGEGAEPGGEDTEEEDRAAERQHVAGTGADEGAGEHPVSEFRLAELKLRVPRGALVAVVGPTASGKTSLLQAILGEMPQAEDCAAGDAEDTVVRRVRPLGFAPQQPWIFNATIRRNILFGEPLIQERYAACVQCCDLDKDFEQLKAGDLTKVGEKGIALSGGQKARVCLARAAYRQQSSGVFLLDDPYSALDAHVAKKVHEEAVLGLLAKKTRIVTTNRLEFAASCDVIVVLSGGRIEAVGPYEAVRGQSETFRSLLAAQGLDLGVDQGAGDDVANQFRRSISAGSAGSAEAEAAMAQQEERRAQGLEEEQEEEEEEEERARGQIKKEVIFYYFQKMGGPRAVSFLALLYASSELLSLALPLWIAEWTRRPLASSELPYYLHVYVLLSLAFVCLMTVRDMVGNIFGFRAARRLHSAMFAAVLRAPMHFFQDTPHGRIINRFSKDTSEIDKDLVWQLIYTVVPVLTVVGNFAMVGGIAYYSLLAFLPAFWLYYLCWRYYNRTILDLKRISKVTSSPVYDHFNNLCRENAVSVVRAHHQVDRECRVNARLVAQQQRPEYSMMYVETWYCVCVETLGCLLLFSVCVFVVLGRGHLVSASSTGLVLTFAGQCSSSIQSLIGQIAEFGMAFNCVERVMDYATRLPSEAALLTDTRPKSGWPSRGVLEVSSLQLRYKPGLPLVLKGITFCTSAGEHIGVVGRTGAGKSSLLLALLRIVEPEAGSRVCLDGEDLMSLGLRDLRAAITTIPQDPILFQESLRYNCDPFTEHTAEVIWEALEEAQLAPWVARGAASSASASDCGAAVAEGEAGSSDAALPAVQLGPPHNAEELLAFEIKEGGQNLSVGQRQMVAIARAVLRGSRLVVLDEATAAIDTATDTAIQLAIRRCFRGATTLTIAHRLQTILDSDRVLVLSGGAVAELGSPSHLRACEDGIFKAMVEEAGL